MKKIAWMLIALLLMSMLLGGCSKPAEETPAAPEETEQTAENLDPIALFVPLVADTKLLDPMLTELYPDLKPGSWDFAVTSGADNPELTARYQEEGGDWYVVQLRIVSGTVYALNTKQLKAANPILAVYRQSDRFYYTCSGDTEGGTGFYEDNVPKDDAEAGMEIKPVLFKSQAQMLEKLNSGLPLELQLDFGEPVPYSELVK